MEEQTNPIINKVSNGGKNNLIAALESLLFIYGEPIGLEKIAELLEVKQEELGEVISGFEIRLKTDNSRGLILNRINNQIQLTTKPDFQKTGRKDNQGRN